MPETRPAAAARPELSFVVETINLRDEGEFGPLDEALEQLQQQTLPPARYEIIVVIDPARQPGLSAQVARAHPQVRVLQAPGVCYYGQKNAGCYYGQKNAGARAARGDIVGFVDADCEPVPTWGETVLGLFATRDGTLGAVQSTYETPGSHRSAIALQFR